MKKIQHMTMVLTILVSFTTSIEANQNYQTPDCSIMKDKMVDKVEQLWTQFSILAKENNISKEMILSKFNDCKSNEKKLLQNGTSFCSDIFTIIQNFNLKCN